MNIEQAVKWLDAIKEKYIHGGDDEMDAKRKEAIDMAIRSLEAWKKVEEEIDTYLWTEGFGSAYRNEIRNIINKALGEVGGDSV